MIVTLLKVTLALALALAALPLMRRASAALRHLLCAAALLATLVLPWTWLAAPRAMAIRVPFAIGAVATSVGPSAHASRMVTPVLLVLWGLGSALLLLRLAAGYRRVGEVLRQATPSGEERGVPVCEADIAVPLAAGLARPAILMPRDSARWPALQRAAALRHELAHIERKDLWTNLVAHLACAVWWFHPLAWAVAHRMRREQETACDDAVLTAGFEPASYAEALIATARYVQPANAISLKGCHMIARKTLKNRIARLLDARLPRMTSTTTLRRAAFGCVAAVACIGLVNAGPQAKGGDAKTADKVYKMSDGITRPALLSKVDPGYTEEARAAKIEGTVRLSAVIGIDGKAHDIDVLDTPDAGLGGKAVEAIEQWRFEPGRLNGEPVAVQANIEVNFKLL